MDSMAIYSTTTVCNRWMMQDTNLEVGTCTAVWAAWLFVSVIFLCWSGYEWSTLSLMLQYTLSDGENHNYISPIVSAAHCKRNDNNSNSNTNSEAADKPRGEQHGMNILILHETCHTEPGKYFPKAVGNVALEAKAIVWSCFFGRQHGHVLVYTFNPFGSPYSLCQVREQNDGW